MPSLQCSKPQLLRGGTPERTYFVGSRMLPPATKTKTPTYAEVFILVHPTG